MYSLWNNNERVIELNPRKLCCKYEVESVRQALLGEIGMHQETTNVLYQLLSDACQERDEARDQLKRAVAEISELKQILNKVLRSNMSVETSSDVSHVPPAGSQKQEILKGSDAMSEAYNNNSDDSSAANSIPRTVFNANLIDSNSNPGLVHKSFVQDSGAHIRMGNFPSKDLEVDSAMKVMDKLVNGKPLPEKGRLLEAVLDAPPLLETLVITGQLPKWRNPPTLPSNLIADEALIKSSSAASSSTLLNFRKRSNDMNLEYLEHAGMLKKFDPAA